ncbi:uncharacterized protein LOC117170962 [Belonocnema kinseyi]|uniref:uncharacterized protein LOC117170962 n=1 Tax=Belonocnema kinseyi TaxID=2817044 RepID=UPI00143CEB7E|nr:uncharacterized protein LOC117170962 [Belonocnema kinseyi]
MAGILIFSVLLSIATLLVTVFATPDGHPFTPRERTPSSGKYRSEHRIDCEYKCELPGKYPFCGKNGCQYTGLMEQECLIKNCGFKVEKDYDGNCKKPAPVDVVCPIRSKGRKHPGRPKKPPLPNH